MPIEPWPTNLIFFIWRTCISHSLLTVETWTLSMFSSLPFKRGFFGSSIQYFEETYRNKCVITLRSSQQLTLGSLAKKRISDKNSFVESAANGPLLLLPRAKRTKGQMCLHRSGSKQQWFKRCRRIPASSSKSAMTYFIAGYFKENVGYPVWTCRDPKNFPTKFHMIRGVLSAIVRPWWWWSVFSFS